MSVFCSQPAFVVQVAKKCLQFKHNQSENPPAIGLTAI